MHKSRKQTNKLLKQPVDCIKQSCYCQKCIDTATSEELCIPKQNKIPPCIAVQRQPALGPGEARCKAGGLCREIPFTDPRQFILGERPQVISNATVMNRLKGCISDTKNRRKESN